MDHPISLHFIWYGPWAKKDEEVQILEFFAKYIDSTPWWSIVRCMEDPAGDPVTDSVDIPSSYIYKSFKKFGKVLATNADLEELLRETITESGLDLDPNDIYVLISHDDVQTPTLCKDECGYHNYFNNSDRTPIKYIFVGSGGLANNNPNCAGCNLNVNGPWGMLTNQLVNSFAHQLANTVTNPVPWTGWYDDKNVEAASKCNHNFVGQTAFLPNKRRNWNIVVSSGTEKHWFLIQGMWDITSNSCRMWPNSDCSIVAPPTPFITAAHDPSSGVMLKAGLSFLVSALVSLFFFF
jgi:hypothetical protein